MVRLSGFFLNPPYLALMLRIVPELCCLRTEVSRNSVTSDFTDC